MNTELFSNTTRQLETLSEPMRRFAQLVVSQSEKLAHFQLEAAKSYAELGIKQARAAMDVNDARSLQQYITEQGRMASALNQRLSEDARTLANIGKEFTDEAQKLTQENVGHFSEAAKQGAQQAAQAAGQASNTKKTA